MLSTAATRGPILRKFIPCVLRQMTMASAADPSVNSSKRKADRPISPPPVKRKGQSSISKGAVASFFTPASQKPREQTRTIWTERAPNDDTPATLLVGRYVPADDEEVKKREKDEKLRGVKRRKIAAFDLDSTLITTASGKRHSDDPADWKWFDASVPTRLRDLYRASGYRIVILSNQGGLALHPDPSSKTRGPKTLGAKDRVAKFKQKCAAVLAQLDVPTSVYAATGKDIYRKPRAGMWAEVCADYDLAPEEVDREGSFFVGDAGGRTAVPVEGSGSGSSSSRGAKKAAAAAAATAAVVAAKDFSCSDRNFAHNVGIAYHTPEEFFLGEKPREFVRGFDLAEFPFSEIEIKNKNKEEEEEEEEEEELAAAEITLLPRAPAQELLLFCGPPGAGKSTFFRQHLQPLSYERVNQDALKTRARCLKAAAHLLGEGKPVAVDNTNPDVDGRREWVELARKHNVPARCVWFRTTAALCEHNDVVRALNKEMNPESRTILPKIAFNTFFSRFKEPTVKEGFEDVVVVDFKFRGTKEEYEIWGRYWN